MDLVWVPSTDLRLDLPEFGIWFQSEDLPKYKRAFNGV